MKVFKIKAHKGESGEKCLCIAGFVDGKELNAIKRKMGRLGITVDSLPVKKWVELALFDYDFE